MRIARRRASDFETFHLAAIRSRARIVSRSREYVDLTVGVAILKIVVRPYFAVKAAQDQRYRRRHFGRSPEENARWPSASDCLLVPILTKV